MSQDQTILPVDSLPMVVAVFGGLGALSAIVFVILTVLKSKSAVCKAPEKTDLEKLSSIEGLQLIKEDGDEILDSGRSVKEQKTGGKKTKKDV